jgi:hypothetical protein
VPSHNAGTSRSESGLPEPAGKHRAERRNRRVTTEPVPGTDTSPQQEPPRHAENENDDRLKLDKPPHWG